MAAVRETRSLILNTAEKLFQERGYNGFSYHDIAAPLNIKNAAVHYHFPGKADLGVALLERYREILRVATKDFMRNGGDATLQLQGYFQFIARRCEKGGKICALGMAASDFHILPEPVQQQARALADETLAWMTRVLKLGREQRHFFYDGSANARAVCVLAALQGAEQLARMAGQGVLEATIRQIASDLGM